VTTSVTFLSRQERFRSVPSTNDIVRAWMTGGTPEVCLAVADEQTLDDQHRGDDHRPGPRAQQHRRQHTAQQVAGDRQREQREVEHLGREDEGRHRAHQHGRPLAQLRPQPPEADHQPAGTHEAGRGGDGG